MSLRSAVGGRGTIPDGPGALDPHLSQGAALGYIILPRTRAGRPCHCGAPLGDAAQYQMGRAHWTHTYPRALPWATLYCPAQGRGVLVIAERRWATRHNTRWAGRIGPTPIPGRCPGLHYTAPHKGGAPMSLRGAVGRRGTIPDGPGALDPHLSQGAALGYIILPRTRAGRPCHCGAPLGDAAQYQMGRAHWTHTYPRALPWAIILPRTRAGRPCHCGAPLGDAAQ
jgi:hypothetical protein